VDGWPHGQAKEEGPFPVPRVASLMVFTTPEIYLDPLQKQWYQIALYGATSYNTLDVFIGPLTEQCADQQNGVTGEYTPQQAWNSFWTILNSDTRTA
jgi:hypothetical protein